MLGSAMTVKEEHFEHKGIGCYVRIEELLRIGSEIFVYIWHVEVDDGRRRFISESHGHFITIARALEGGKTFAISAVEIMIG